VELPYFIRGDFVPAHQSK